MENKKRKIKVKPQKVQLAIKGNELKKYYIFDLILVFKIKTLKQGDHAGKLHSEGKRYYLFGFIPVWGKLNYKNR